MIKKIRRVSLDAFPLVKRIAYLELILKSICEKKDIDIEELFKKLNEANVEYTWNLNTNDVGLNELMNKTKKGRVEICKEKVTKVLEEI